MVASPNSICRPQLCLKIVLTWVLDVDQPADLRLELASNPHFLMCCHAACSADLDCHASGHSSHVPCSSSVHHSEASFEEPAVELEGIVTASTAVKAGGFGDNLDWPMRRFVTRRVPCFLVQMIGNLSRGAPGWATGSSPITAAYLRVKSLAESWVGHRFLLPVVWDHLQYLAARHCYQIAAVDLTFGINYRIKIN